MRPILILIAFAPQLIRSNTATLARSSTFSGSCQVGNAAAWSPPRIRKSSSFGDSLRSCSSVSAVYDGPSRSISIRELVKRSSSAIASSTISSRASGPGSS